MVDDTVDLLAMGPEEQWSTIMAMSAEDLAKALGNESEEVVSLIVTLAVNADNGMREWEVYCNTVQKIAVHAAAFTGDARGPLSRTALALLPNYPAAVTELDPGAAKACLMKAAEILGEEGYPKGVALWFGETLVKINKALTETEEEDNGA